jgi:tetratricopeptide (TPR) repeat protein
MVQAWKAHFDGRHDAARSLFAALIAEYPGDKTVQYLAGESLFHGPYQPESEALFRRALDLDPGFAPAAAHLRDLLVAQDRAREALDQVRRTVQARRTAAAQIQLVIALAQAGDLVDAVSAARAQSSASATGAELFAARALAGLGRFEEAEEVLGTLAAGNRPPVVRLAALRTVTDVFAMEGKRAKALETLAESRRQFPDAELAPVIEIHYLWNGGRVDAVREFLSLRKERDPSWAATYEYFGLRDRAAGLAQGLVAGSLPERNWRACVAFRAGHPGDRIDLLRERAGTPNTPNAFLLGEALAAAGRCPEALIEFERVQRLFPAWHPAPWVASYWPESFVRHARCLDAVSRRDEALAELDRFLDRWKAADQDLPLLAEARSLRQSVAARR